MRDSITEFCAAIGTDPLLVQGAGGNVSWKVGDTLWVKASGTWLSEAARRDIFVPVQLSKLQSAMASGDFDITPESRGNTALRPSIETLLHALMPHPVVVHLHMVDVLSYLVRRDFEAELHQRVGSSLAWVATQYQKPGKALAEAVSTALARQADAQVVFLQNHGVVIGGADVKEIDTAIRTLTDAFRAIPRESVNESFKVAPIVIDTGLRYLPVSDTAVHLLATDVMLFNRLKKDWALYPDHVVFLGARPACHQSIDSVISAQSTEGMAPELIFVRNTGVFVHPDFNIAKQVQLRCYYDVLSRLPNDHEINSLTYDQIADLLNWDAEQYRMSIAK